MVILVSPSVSPSVARPLGSAAERLVADGGFCGWTGDAWTGDILTGGVSVVGITSEVVGRPWSMMVPIPMVATVRR